MVSYIAGTESIGLVASSEASYFETIEFYASLGFVEIRSYSRNESTSDDPVYCSDSIREAWLMNFDDETDETLTLKIRLVPGEVVSDSQAHQSAQDWRGQTGHIAFKCRDLNVSPRLVRSCASLTSVRRSERFLTR